MTRFRLVLEYDGGPFVGWQRQDNGPSVQQALEEAVLGFCGETVICHGAGRTDAGVHALGQAGLIQIDSPIPTENLARAITGRLPDDIAIVGYDDIEIASYLEVPLTTIRQKRYELGQKAAAILIARIEAEDEDTRSDREHVVFTPELVIRESA